VLKGFEHSQRIFQLIGPKRVLLFDNLSADPEQSYFVDGLTKELITVL
jgi:TolB-like protein